MVSKVLLQKFEEQVQHLGGKIIRDCKSEADFRSRALDEMGRVSKSWGFYNDEERIGVVFPDSDQAYAMGKWDKIGKVLVSPCSQIWGEDPELDKFKRGFRYIVLEP